MGTRVGLVGCVKSKRDVPTRAADLYISPLFLGRRAFVEASCDRWYILSAEHGLIDPDRVVGPYERSLADAPRSERRDWAARVLEAIEATLGRELRGFTFEVHAGGAYRNHGLVNGLRLRGAQVAVPAEGLTRGQQLAFYGGGGKAHAGPRTEVVLSASSVEILDVEALEEFSFFWPEGPEIFELGWDFSVRADGQDLRLRHGIGGRRVYGRFRVHTVTWVAKAPMVEGVAAEDYLESRALLSLLRREDGRHVRSLDEIPKGYEGFMVVPFNRELSGPRVPSSLGVKIAEDDLATWARHALLRAAQKGARLPEGSSRPRGSGIDKPAVNPGPAPKVDGQAIARDLLAFGATLTEGHSRFTPHDDANELVTTDPFAFLVGVIADQGIKVERAWELPFNLKGRLGHLDPTRIIADPEAVSAAFTEPPKLHRFVNGVPRWIVAAAEIVLQNYGGDAERIWGDSPTAVELQRRLDLFPGIGQKKAAMAVEILAQGLGKEVRELTGSDVAYDVHVRRVFLRTGIAERDEVRHMIEVARRLHPERPGSLDLPAWMVGREWCHPSDPECGACPVGSCPRLVARARHVRGV